MKRQTYLFLFFLGLIAFFVVGFRYGQHTNQIDKNLLTILKITPTVVPSLTPSIENYTTFDNPGCHFQFLLPVSISVGKSGSNSAQLQFPSGEKALSFQCGQVNTLNTLIDTKHTATASVTFQQRKITEYTDDTMTYFVVKHPLRAFSVFFAVHKNLYPLLEETLQFK